MKQTRPVSVNQYRKKTRRYLFLLGGVLLLLSHCRRDCQLILVTRDGSAQKLPQKPVACGEQTKLNLDLRGVRAVAGLEDYSDLKELEIRDWGHAGLKPLRGLAKLEDLRDLRFVNSRLESLKGLPALEELRRLSLRSAPRLKKIGTQLKLPRLEKMEIMGGRLRVLDGTDNLKALRSLRVSHNQLRDLRGITHLEKLETLLVSVNEIEDLTGLRHLSNLVTLDLTRNRLSDLTALSREKVQWPALKNLRLSENQIEDVSPLSGGNLPALEFLDLRSNRIAKLGKFWRGTPALKHLYLKDNPLEKNQKNTLTAFQIKSGTRVIY